MGGDGEVCRDGEFLSKMNKARRRGLITLFNITGRVLKQAVSSGCPWGVGLGVEKMGSILLFIVF